MLTSEDSAKIVVQDHFREHVRFLFTPSTGKFSQLTSMRAPAGFGCVIKTTQRDPVVFAALYAFHERLYFSVGDKAFDLTNPAFKVAVNRSFFTRLVRVFDGPKPIFEIRYRTHWVYFSSWPTSGDFLEWVTELTARMEDRLQAIARWTASAEGEDIGRAEVKTRIQEHFRRLSG